MDFRCVDRPIATNGRRLGHSLLSHRIESHDHAGVRRHPDFSLFTPIEMTLIFSAIIGVPALFLLLLVLSFLEEYDY